METENDTYQKKEVTCMCINPDRTYLFITNKYGFLTQWTIVNIEEVAISKDYGKCHDNEILSMDVNSKYVVTGDASGVLKQWDYHNEILLKDYGEVHESAIGCVRLMVEGQSDYLFTADKHNIRQWSFSDHKYVQIKDYPFVHKEVINDLILSANNTMLYSVDKSGEIKIHDVEKKEEVPNYTHK